MPYFKTSRDVVVPSRYGYAIRFIAGQPTWVPDPAIREVIAAGAVAEDSGDVPVEVPAITGKTPTVAELNSALIAAFDLLVAEGDTKKFSAAGVPTVKAVESLIDYDVTSQQVKDAWEGYKRSKV